MAGPVKRDEARRVVLDLASRFHGEDLSDASIISISGRYEFHNKGLDAFLDAIVDLEGRYDKNVLALLLVPAGNSGLRQEVGKRMHMPLEEITGSLGISTHNHFDGASDPILSYCKRIGLDNDRSRHVKILQIPVYLTGSDGILNIPHEAVLRACDLTVFPSFYEPWGYTPRRAWAWACRRSPRTSPASVATAMPRASVTSRASTSCSAWSCPTRRSAPRSRVSCSGASWSCARGRTSRRRAGRRPSAPVGRI
jgi:glycosyltransferase involved in cell wall biosynthesis